jgi:hypothetical protein
VECVDAAIARQQRGKHVSMAIIKHTTIDELLEVMFSMPSMPKLLRLQNKVLHTIGNFPRCTPDHDLQTAFNLPYAYDYSTKLCSNKQRSYIIMRKNMFTA